MIHPATMADSNPLLVEEPADALPPLNLEDLPPRLRDACASAGWPALMPVQARALPYLLNGRDLMVQSRTGSGKTGAYLLPMLDRLDPALKAVQGLVLAPTRELAAQVEHEARILFAGSGLEVAAVYGGVGYGKQMEALKRGVSLVVGTPGRVLDHLLRRTLVLDKVSSLVFDEADRMLSIGFYPDMKEIQRYLPQRPLHATLFSATYPPHVLRLAGEFLHDPELLSLSAAQVHVAEVQHYMCECKSMDKDRTLLRIMELENPASAIVFCNTKSNVHYVTAVLQGFGFNADELSADLSQGRREEVMDRLRRGQIRFLVATDVAARGIDIPDLSHVILFEPPEDRESYIHRAGRTGRAGAAGVVITLADIMQKLEMKRIAQFYKIPFLDYPAPTDEAVNQAVALRLTAQLEARQRQLTGLERERLGRFSILARDMAADPELAQLLCVVLDDWHQRCRNPEGLSHLPAQTESRGAEPRGRASSGRGGRRREASEPRSDSRRSDETPVAPVASGAAPAAEGERAGQDKPRRPRQRRRRGPAGGEGSSSSNDEA